MQPSDTDRYGMNSEAPLPSWLTALLEEAGSDTLILKAGDPPYVVRSGSTCHLSTVPLTRVSMEALALDILSDDGRSLLSARGSVRLVLRGPDIPVEVRADRLDDQLVVRLRQLGEAGHAKSSGDATADLVAALGAAARTPEVEAAIDALRQRLHKSGGSARDAERREETTAATVVELHRRREIATDRFSVDDWVAEAVARGARTLYLPAGSVPYVRIEGHVSAFSSDVLPLAMFEQAAAAMTAEQDGWYRTRGELEWSKHVPDVGTIRCHAFSDVRGGGLVVDLPASEPFGLEHVIPAHVRAACEAGDGMVIISAPFAEDVAAMVEAVVAWHARRRPGYFIAFGRGSGLERLAGRCIRQREASSRHPPGNGWRDWSCTARTTRCARGRRRQQRPSGVRGNRERRRRSTRHRRRGRQNGAARVGGPPQGPCLSRGTKRPRRSLHQRVQLATGAPSRRKGHRSLGRP